MKSILTLVLGLSLLLTPWIPAAEPLRVYIRSGPKTHGPGQHDYPRFLKDWVALLNERGARAEGGNEFPSAGQLEKTDVLVLHAEEAGNVNIGEERKNLLAFLKRGGGVVVIHGGAVARDYEWFKGIVGGSWKHGQTKWLEGPMSVYFTDRKNPITKDCSNFDIDDEIYYDMDLLPEVNILAAAYTPKASGARNADAVKKAEKSTDGGKRVSIYDIQPQMWTYEKDNYRAFVSIPGHLYKNFSHNSIRTMLLRGIAWAGKRENVDELCKADELADALRYPEGGPTRPELAAKKIEVHPEFNLSLVAAEPLINKAMSVDWDEKGRMWVAETPEYPNGLRQANTEVWKESGSVKKGEYQRDPIDCISILSDTNGDGVMDAKKVFADKLELVTSFVFYKNGVIACAAPDIWFLEDTDGDEVADKRTKLYTGLGTADTHAVMNNLRWGLDGWVYATHGYSAGDVVALGEGASKEPVRISSGVVRFRPDGTAIEAYSSKNGNTWGLCMTWDGQCFWTQPTSGTVFFHTVLPEYLMARGKVPGANGWKGMITGQKSYPMLQWEQQAYVQIDQVGAFTAAAGCAVYEGGAWPEKWNYSYFTGEPTINIVHHQFVKKDGVSYRTEKEAGREETEFMRSSDLWFRPIETRIGPDGALYVIDFYNQAVIHNDTRGPLHGPANAAVRPDRDHYFSRIWKVQHKQAKKVEVPVLEKGDMEGLVKVLLESPNAHQKMNALRLLAESPEFLKTMMVSAKFESSRLRDLLFRLNGSFHGKASTVDGVEFNRQEFLKMDEKQRGEVVKALLPVVDSGDRSPMEIIALGSYTVDAGVRSVLLKAYEAADEDWTRSAILIAAKHDGGLFVADAMKRKASAAMDQFVEVLVPLLLEQADEAEAKIRELLAVVAQAPAEAEGLQMSVLRTLAKGGAVKLKLDEALAQDFESMLTRPKLASVALPLMARWDGDGRLKESIDKQAGLLAGRFKDESLAEGDRLLAAQALIGLGDKALLKDVMAVLVKADGPVGLQKSIIAALSDRGELTELAQLFGSLSPALKGAAFDEILKRPEATMALLQAVEQEKVKAAEIGPGNVARLRTHPNREVASRASKLMDKLNPGAKAKNEIIARLLPEVVKPGNVENGKLMFAAACAVCHKYGDVGTRDVGPPLTGMGAHGPAELLTHVVDPNREVDPSFWQWNISTKNGDAFAGVIVSENASGLTLRHQGGEVEIRKVDIATRENTHRSLMPEGLDALGAEVLRDILAFMTAGDAKFRVVDLREVYTADARRGLFAKEEATVDSVFPVQYGNVQIEGIPFFLMDPAKSSNGLSLVALKGGGANVVANTYPQKVELGLNVAAKRLHLLSGIAGWGWPATKDQRGALKVTLTHADGQVEVTELLNGVAFADYNREIEVPGSKLLNGAVKRGQLRLISLEVKKPGPITKVVLESYDNGVTPLVLAVTADLEGSAGFVVDQSVKPTASVEAVESGPKEGGKGDGPLAPAGQANWEEGKMKVLVIGGGSSHDFAKFFGTTDVETLRGAGFSVFYTEDRDQVVTELAKADVAVISVNRRFFDTSAYRKALMEFADAGKGIVMLHPGTWYAYPQWPELNAKIVGGGSRGHDKLGEFSVKVVNKEHAVTKGLPGEFSVVDELYYVNAEEVPEGTVGIEVLAETSPSQKYGKGHPSVWLAKHPKARVVNIALGHDERVHELEAFKTLLKNAANFVGKMD
jgi:putative membrane-bound dehydrogenase-like protein